MRIPIRVRPWIPRVRIRWVRVSRVWIRWTRICLPGIRRRWIRGGRIRGCWVGRGRVTGSGESTRWGTKGRRCAICRRRAVRWWCTIRSRCAVRGRSAIGRWRGSPREPIHPRIVNLIETRSRCGTWPKRRCVRVVATCRCCRRGGCHGRISRARICRAWDRWRHASVRRHCRNGWQCGRRESSGGTPRRRITRRRIASGWIARRRISAG